VLVAADAVKGAIEVWGMRESAVGVMRAVRREFDGKGVLSPGRFVG
jgi:glycolate oxidase FAD binding subunit